VTKDVVDHGGVVDLAGDPARTRALRLTQPKTAHAVGECPQSTPEWLICGLSATPNIS